MEDQEILRLIRSGGHAKALDRLYEGYPAIKKFILSHAGDSEDAKDVFQEALIVFCQKAAKPDFQLTSKVSTYVYSVCKYLWKDRLVQLNKWNNTTEFKEPVSEELDIDLEEQKFNYLDDILNELSDRCKKVLQGYYVFQWSMKQLAEKLNYTSEASAKNQKYKCLEKAKEKAKAFKSTLNASVS